MRFLSSAFVCICLFSSYLPFSVSVSVPLLLLLVFVGPFHFLLERAARFQNLFLVLFGLGLFLIL